MSNNAVIFMILCKDEDPKKVEDLILYQTDSVVEELKQYYHVSSDAELSVKLSVQS